MSKINAELWKEIQNNIYPDPHKTHEAIYAIVQSQITLAQQRTEKKCGEEMRKRCLLFGCVYGIEHVDKKPKDHCIFCGEPTIEQDDFWFEPNPSVALNKVLDKYKDNPKALSDLLK